MAEAWGTILLPPSDDIANSTCAVCRGWKSWNRGTNCVDPQAKERAGGPTKPSPHADVPPFVWNGAPKEKGVPLAESLAGLVSSSWNVCFFFLISLICRLHPNPPCCSAAQPLKQPVFCMPTWQHPRFTARIFQPSQPLGKQPAQQPRRSPVRRWSYPLWFHQTVEAETQDSGVLAGHVFPGAVEEDMCMNSSKHLGRPPITCQIPSQQTD
ncbi:hypothetical protein B0H65DRAFT_136027 [Neurospora tetraspora]|uniref:Uncharacterized protein n=1 Tax=Neurospora tetraspora TaxID=94610 RepID=A0AAE0MVA1_9PEZI|nr:hypothetical protein B0H65DRAFT_136027 [Neurospora tetraspora]